jgi:excisionase family DNA binding protein
MGRLVGLQKEPILDGDSPSSLQYLTRQAEPRANRHSDHEQNSTQAIRYMERLLTADELAERLGMKTEWVWAQARAGRIPHVRLGRYRRFRESAVDAWLQDLETGGSGRLATPQSHPIPLRRRT